MYIFYTMQMQPKYDFRATRILKLPIIGSSDNFAWTTCWYVYVRKMCTGILKNILEKVLEYTGIHWNISRQKRTNPEYMQKLNIFITSAAT